MTVKTKTSKTPPRNEDTIKKSPPKAKKKKAIPISEVQRMMEEDIAGNYK